VREYETTFIVQPEISEEGGQAILSRLDGILERTGDVRLYCDDLGKRKLAYEIRKFHKGHYYTLAYLGEGKAVPELEQSLRHDESVLRFLTILANPEVEDAEARKVAAAEYEQEQARRAAEKAAREAEEARAREEAERAAAAEQAEAAAARDDSDSDDADEAGSSGDEERSGDEEDER
jgi:small subunit ribosomal protein S6